MLYKTTKVKVKKTGQIAIIKAKNFDPGVHEPIEGTPRKVLEEDPTTPAYGTQSRKELAQMTVEVLLTLPEVTVLDETPKGKGELIDAILKVREAAAE